MSAARRTPSCEALYSVEADVIGCVAMDEKDPESDTFHPDAILPDGSLVGRRRRGDQEAIALLRPVKDDESVPIEDEIVRLRRGADKGVMTVEQVVRSKGPARVASRSYRRNYDSIFGARHSHAVN